MKKILILALSLGLAGCSRPKYQFDYDHPTDSQVEAYILDTCLKSARGPQSTKYNDWDEAIYACANTAESMARYCPPQDTALCLPRYQRTREDARTILPKELTK